MTDNESNNTKPSFNFPEYINVPLFLAQDERLHKKSTILASWLYTLHTSGKIIKVSNSYLCAFLIIKPRQLNYIFEELENYKYIIRVGKTSSRSIEWVYQPESRITIDEDFEASALDCTSRIASALDCTSDMPKNYPLVQSSGNSLCTPVHTYTRVDNKNNNNISVFENFKKKEEEVAKQVLEELNLKSEEQKIKHAALADHKCLEAYEVFWSSMNIDICILYETCQKYWESKGKQANFVMFLNYLKNPKSKEYFATIKPSEGKKAVDKSAINEEEQNKLHEERLRHYQKIQKEGKNCTY